MEEEPISKNNKSSSTKLENVLCLRSIPKNHDVQPVRKAGQEEEDNSEGEHQGSGLQ